MRAEFCVIGDFLNNSIVNAAYQIFQELQIHPGSFFLNLADINKDNIEFSSTYGPTIALLIKEYCLRFHQLLVNNGYEVCDEFEIWTNFGYECGENVVFHVDNDELTRKRTGQVRSPLAGSIMYLGPSYIRDGGGTCFCIDPNTTERTKDLMFKSVPWGKLWPILEETSIIVPFRAGRMIFFKGDIAHCVVPFKKHCEGLPRVAMLVNAWAKRQIIDI